MVLCRINKNYPYLSPNIPSYLELCYIIIFIYLADTILWVISVGVNILGFSSQSLQEYSASLVSADCKYQGPVVQN